MQPAATDTELWHAFKQGDREGFGILFHRFYPLLCQYGNKLCKDLNLVEDAIQELFLELWQSNSHAPVQSVKAYLLKATRYKILKMMKGKMNYNLEMTENAAFEISHDNFLIRHEEEKQTAARLIAALQQLPNRQKEIIYLKLFQGLSYEELTEIMQINYQATRNLFYEAIKSLRKTLSHQ